MSVFLWMCACVCVFVCKRMYVLMCVCADVSPRQLLFLVVHFHLACDMTQPDTTTWACEACHKLICKLVVFYHISSLLPLKVCPYVCPESAHVLHTCVGWWCVRSPEIACPNLYLCTCGQINTDYHNHIWLWHDIDFQSACFCTSLHLHLGPGLLKAYPVSEHTLFRETWAKEKISL